MDLFDKCRKLDTLLKFVRLQRHFYYCRPVAPAASPLICGTGHRLINLGSQNYLGLTDHPAIKEAARDAVEKYVTGCAGSRLLTRTTPLHLDMEKRLARFKNTESAITYSAGLMALAATVSTLAGEGDFIFSDELNHASIIDGVFSMEGDVCNLPELRALADEHHARLTAAAERGRYEPKTQGCRILGKGIRHSHHPDTDRR